jgi:UDP-N-acetylglucosamine acyltransferase
MSASIHKTAVISEGAEIGHGVSIGPYAVIGPKVRIADNVIIGSHVLIEGRTTIGEGTHIHPFATVGIPPQDLKYKGEDTSLIIGKRNQIREYVNISIGTEGGGGETVIGDENLIMSYTHIAHDCRIHNRCIIANAANIAGHVVVSDGAVLGGVVGVHQFCRIGELSMVAGGSMVAQDVPPFCMVHGDRATINGLNVVGLRRAPLDSERVSDIKTMFRMLYKENYTVAQAIEKIRAEIPESRERELFVTFLEKSTRGICR